METIVTPLLESVFALRDSMAANVKNVSEFYIFRIIVHQSQKYILTFSRTFINLHIY